MCEIGEMVAGWAAEGVDAATAHARVERLWDSLSKDAADLQEQIGDVGGGNAGMLAQARRVLAALDAAVAALTAVSARL